MAQTVSHPDCPALATLIEWVDGTLDGAGADRVERHLDRCSGCRRRALDWSAQLASAPAAAEVPAGCLDAETLVAYCAAGGGLDRAAAAHIETHLQQCTRCVATLRQFMRLQRESAAGEAAAALRTDSAAAAGAGAVESARADQRVRAAVPAWWEWVRDLLTPRLWTGAALAATLAVIVAVGVSHFVSPSGPYEEMRVRDATHAAGVEVTTDTVGRPRPSADEPALVELSRGTQARWLEANGEWTRIELADGRRVWVDSQAVARVRSE
jgi:anti-sigma factor RsiW